MISFTLNDPDLATDFIAFENKALEENTFRS